MDSIVLYDDDNLNTTKDIGMETKSFISQVLVASGCWALHFCIGMLFGTPTVLIPQLRRANITITDDMASWISSTFCYAAAPWLIILAMLVHNFGRKKTCIFISFSTIFSYIAFYFSTTVTHFLITEVGFGITQAAVPAITSIIISEYTLPKYRGMFLCVKSAIFFWGIWVANAIGIFTFWMYIPIVGFSVSIFSLTIFFWPESPHWLASKNRLAECRQTHRWLKGRSETAEMELENIIQSQTELNISHSLTNVKLLLGKEFGFPLLLSMLALLQYQLSGKFVITIYAMDVLKTITNNESEIYSSMLILDGVSVFSAYIGSFVAKYFKRRTLLISTSIMSMSFLVILSLYLYLVNLGVCFESVYVSIFLLAAFSIVVCCGPMILGTSLYGELIPAKFKSIAVVIVGVQYTLSHGVLIKLGLTIFKEFGLHGTFLFYAICTGACTLLIYLYMPETKDKTLLEIEKYFSNKNTGQVDESRNLVR